MKTNLQFESYEELIYHLRNCIHWNSTDVYETGGHFDFIGTVHMMLAVLDNLKSNGREVDFEEIGWSFDPSQKAFFLKLADILKENSDS